LSLEPLEERRLLAIMTVTDLGDDTLANLAGDSQLSLREAIEAINTAANVDGIGPTSARSASTTKSNSRPHCLPAASRRSPWPTRPAN
jgi:hypothetical protein